jgi:hypothetical protein
MLCMTVSLAAGGEGLGACWGEEKVRELLAESGVRLDRYLQRRRDPLNVYYRCSP